MLTSSEAAALEQAWAPARAAGVLGTTTLEEVWEHTAGFTSAVCSAFAAEASDLTLRLVDVGTGAGVPGLLLACQLPGCHITLVDASERRLDHVRRARRALGLENRTDVVHGRAEELGRLPHMRERFDGAVARLLADPRDAMELLAPLVRDDGVLVVSTADDARGVWDRLPVPRLPLGAAQITGMTDRYASVRRIGELPDALPRNAKVRRRDPLIP